MGKYSGDINSGLRSLESCLRKWQTSVILKVGQELKVKRKEEYSDIRNNRHAYSEIEKNEIPLKK